MEMNMNTNTSMQNSVVGGNTYHAAGKETTTSTFALDFQKMESESNLSETLVETSSVTTTSEMIYEQMSSTNTQRRDVIAAKDSTADNAGTAAESDAAKSTAKSRTKN